MRIHHVDCGTLHPLGGALMDGISPGAVARLSCHCLIVETDRHGLVLVDTGFGEEDLRHPWPRLPGVNLALLGLKRDLGRTARRRVQALGFRPEDVRHVVLTHLDFDHAGGLADFPHATIHVTAAEAEAARRRQGLLGRIRWRPAQWGDTRHWRTYGWKGEEWFGFRAVRELDGLPPDILLVPLPGHSPGHAGVALRGPRGWMLHAGDAYFHRAEVHGDGAAPPGLRAYDYAMTDDVALRDLNRRRVRLLARDPGAGVVVFCTHDAVELAALAAWSAGGRSAPVPPPDPAVDAAA